MNLTNYCYVIVKVWGFCHYVFDWWRTLPAWSQWNLSCWLVYWLLTDWPSPVPLCSPSFKLRWELQTWSDHYCRAMVRFLSSLFCSDIKTISAPLHPHLGPYFRQGRTWLLVGVHNSHMGVVRIESPLDTCCAPCQTILVEETEIKANVATEPLRKTKKKLGAGCTLQWFMGNVFMLTVEVLCCTL